MCCRWIGLGGGGVRGERGCEAGEGCEGGCEGECEGEGEGRV